MHVGIGCYHSIRDGFIRKENEKKALSDHDKSGFLVNSALPYSTLFITYSTLYMASEKERNGTIVIITMEKRCC